MLDQALIAVAAAGGTAVVQAAGSDAWTGLREALARWFGRGDARRQQAELERLDRAASELVSAAADTRQTARVRQEAAWQARIEALLESLDETEQGRAGKELRALLAQYSPGGAMSADSGGLVVGGDVHVHAEGGSIAAAVNQGGARIGPPAMPDPNQG